MTIKSLTITSTRNWETFVSLIRKVSLIGDASVFPYQNATIESRVVDPHDVFPISLYVLRPHLVQQKQLHDVLFKDHGIDTFDQDGDTPDISFRVEGEKGHWKMAPPIVEVSDVDGGKPILVDGEHRFMLARELGKPVRVVWVTRVSTDYPIMACPVAWRDIKICDTVPNITHKRKYRFPTLDSFPDIGSFSKVKITKNNYRYYFYRDLNPVCTTGIREEAT